MSEQPSPKGDLTFECDLPQEPAKVWRALTEPGLAARWLAPGGGAAELGARFTLTPPGGPVDCEVLEAEPERRLRYAWREEGLDSVVTFEVSPADDGGTHLKIVHSGLVPASATILPFARRAARRPAPLALAPRTTSLRRAA